MEGNPLNNMKPSEKIRLISIINAKEEEIYSLRGRQIFNHVLLSLLAIISALSMGTCRARTKRLGKVGEEKAGLVKKVKELTGSNQKLTQEHTKLTQKHTELTWEHKEIRELVKEAVGDVGPAWSEADGDGKPTPEFEKGNAKAETDFYDACKTLRIDPIILKQLQEKVQE